MKRKRDPISNMIKWKARLCAGGHRSVEFFWTIGIIIPLQFHGKPSA